MIELLRLSQIYAPIIAMHAPIDLRRTQHAMWLAEELNFSRAAARASLSPTAFSRSIQMLEKALGLQLFERGTRHVEVTAAGAQWLTQARSVLTSAGNLSALASELSQGDGGELRIGATPLALDCGLSDALLALRQRRPRLQLYVDSGQWLRMRGQLLADQIELFVGYPGTSSDQQDCVVLPLIDQPVSVFANACHPLAAQGQCTFQQILTYPWACVQLAPSIRSDLEALAYGSTSPLVLETDNQALLRSTMMQSDTLLLTWPQWLKEDLACGRVVDIGARVNPRPPAALQQLSCAVVHRIARGLSPAAQQLIQMLGSVNYPDKQD
ncbi:LysR family transcriptional regulator [Pseudomonas aeruginosa]|nr:LysR family transcriptional regulator [Pseudomonas aeruginosa]MBG7044184.1 LysR family transcriptional regulator [Pseudomonas aeruginosa]HBO2348464.1 LysR family transcriptional regulator [Pseudomonas aeruginosa]